VSAEFEARSDRVLEFFGDDGKKMIRAANEFLLEMEKRAIHLEDIDPEVAETVYIPKAGN